ncbi:MAG: hypothetical protein ACUVQI_10325, partial [Thermochromatium sp.]
MEWQRQYEAWQADNRLSKPSEATLRRQLNASKREQFPWLLEVAKCVPQMAIIQLGEACKNVFAGRAWQHSRREKRSPDPSRTQRYLHARIANIRQCPAQAH